MHFKEIGGGRRNRSDGGHHAGAKARHHQRGKAMKETYHYTECGLNNIWLLDGFAFRRTPYGNAVSIVNMPGLNAAIARILVRDKPRWSGGEFRFIRKELDMSQAGLARIFGKDPQTVARWEKSGRVPKMADRFMRALHREHVGGNERMIETVDRLNDTDQKQYARLQFETKRDGWKLRVA